MLGTGRGATAWGSRGQYPFLPSPSVLSPSPRAGSLLMSPGIIVMCSEQLSPAGKRVRESARGYYELALCYVEAVWLARLRHLE